MQDLDGAYWAEIPRDAYMQAARFLVAHNVVYSDLMLSESEAAKLFHEAGKTCEAVRAQATRVEADADVPVKLSGPADCQEGGQVIAVDEATVEAGEPLDGMEANDTENPFADDAMPGFRCSAEDPGLCDLDVERCIKEFAAKLEMLVRSRKDGRGGKHGGEELSDFRHLATQMSSAQLQAKLDAMVAEMDRVDNLAQQAASADSKQVQVVHTGSVPLSMYSPEYWQKCFPLLFPYGDGVYGVVRDTPLSFRDWARYCLTRTELEYQVAGEKDGSAGGSACALGRGFQPPVIPRWSGEMNFVSVACDTWKRMEMVRCARGHVKRKGFKQSLKSVVQCTSSRLSAAVAALGQHATIADIMRSSVVDSQLRDAISQLLFFSADVIGTDGARQQLRHEQNGAMLRREDMKW